MANPNFLSDFFPYTYYDLISSYATVKYVSATGSNSNDGNSKDTPYLTVENALSVVSSDANTVAIVVLPGTYSISATATATFAGFCSSGIKDGNLPRVFICSPGQVIFNITDSTALRDFSPIEFQNSQSAIYGAIIKRNNGGRTNSYSTAFFNDETSAFKGKAYNCVYQEVNANNLWSLQYDNGNNSTADINNCVIYTGANGVNDWSGSTGARLTSSVFNYTYGSTSMSLVDTVTNQSVDPTTYVTTGQTTRGVYSGTYDWGGTTEPPPPGLTISSNIIFKGQSVNIEFRSDIIDNGNVPYTISGVTTEFINNSPLTGNFVISNYTGNITITTTPDGTANTVVMNITANIYSTSISVYPPFSYNLEDFLVSSYSGVATANTEFLSAPNSEFSTSTFQSNILEDFLVSSYSGVATANTEFLSAPNSEFSTSTFQSITLEDVFTPNFAQRITRTSTFIATGADENAIDYAGETIGSSTPIQTWYQS
jgi:hypothetical protein